MGSCSSFSSSSSSCSMRSQDSWRNGFGISPMWLTFILATLLILSPIVNFIIIPRAVRFLASLVGVYLRRKTEGRRSLIVGDSEPLLKTEDEKPKGKRRVSEEGWESVDNDAAGLTEKWNYPRDWQGVIGFFHPFCNAGGGGERVLWAAIRATQKRFPNAHIVVYTGDHDADKTAIITRVQSHFNIELYPPTITFLYLTTRHWVLASQWPHFTLLGQSLGSLILAWDAFSLLVPDVLVDTMGYAFALGFSKLLFPNVPTGAYVHYPTISTDMLDSLNVENNEGGHGVNAGKGKGLQGIVKLAYWKLFAKLYVWMGASVDVVMTNSSWTQGHITSLWGPARKNGGKRFQEITPIFPPVAVEELEKEIDVSEESEKRREKALVYIAQFRPEKNHTLILNAFAQFKETKTAAAKDAKLVLIGNVRDDSDSKRVYELRLLVNELKIKDSVEFYLDATWPEILDWLGRASIGVNGMWNEHFGIGVVEYQAAGLISVVHNSGGPRRDIVTPIDGEITGFHASNAAEFADGFEKALSLPDPLSMRRRARRSAQRFTEEAFAKSWTAEMDKLVLIAA